MIREKKFQNFCLQAKSAKIYIFCLIQMNSQNSSYLKVRRNYLLLSGATNGVSAIIELSLIKTKNV